MKSEIKIKDLTFNYLIPDEKNLSLKSVIINIFKTNLFKKYTVFQNFNLEINNNDRINRRTTVPNVNGRVIPTKELYGKMYSPFEKEPEDRINPDLLTAFKNNPYTQSLNSS